MKRLFRVLTAAALCVSALACGRSEHPGATSDEGPAGEEPENNVIYASCPSITRLSANESLSGVSLLWKDGDAITIFDNSGNAYEYGLVDGNGTNHGTFSGECPSSDMSNISVFPHSASNSLSGEGLTVEVPSSLSYGYMKFPLLGLSDGGSDFAFQSLGGTFRFTYSDVPENARKFVFSAFSQKVSGSFLLNPVSESSVLETENCSTDNVVEITFSDPAEVSTLYVPVPAGLYTGFRVSMEDNSGKAIADSWKSTIKSFLIEKNHVTPLADISPEVRMASCSYVHGGPYDLLSSSSSVVYMPSARGNYSYAHHPGLAWFQGKWYAVFSQGLDSEDRAGQRVALSTSTDFSTWSTPVALVSPCEGDYGYTKVLTPGGVCVLDGFLVIYYTENDTTDGTASTRTNTKLYAIRSSDGSTWSDPVDTGLRIFPSHCPIVLSNGRLVMTCNAKVYYSDVSSGLSGWKAAGEASQTQDGCVTYDSSTVGLCEGEIFENRDGSLLNLFRNSKRDNRQWQSQSFDSGLTWTSPVQSLFPNDNTKSCFLSMPDNRYIFIGTPDVSNEGARFPLVVAVSNDGYDFQEIYLLGNTAYTKQFSGTSKSGDFGYPYAVIKDGWAYVLVSRWKERMDAIKFQSPGNDISGSIPSMTVDGSSEW